MVKKLGRVLRSWNFKVKEKPIKGIIWRKNMVGTGNRHKAAPLRTSRQTRPTRLEQSRRGERSSEGKNKNKAQSCSRNCQQQGPDMCVLPRSFHATGGGHQQRDSWKLQEALITDNWLWMQRKSLFPWETGWLWSKQQRRNKHLDWKHRRKKRQKGKEVFVLEQWAWKAEKLLAAEKSTGRRGPFFAWRPGEKMPNSPRV